MSLSLIDVIHSGSNATPVPPGFSIIKQYLEISLVELRNEHYTDEEVYRLFLSEPSSGELEYYLQIIVVHSEQLQPNQIMYIHAFLLGRTSTELNYTLLFLFINNPRVTASQALSLAASYTKVGSPSRSEHLMDVVQNKYRDKLLNVQTTG